MTAELLGQLKDTYICRNSALTNSTIQSMNITELCRILPG